MLPQLFNQTINAPRGVEEEFSVRFRDFPSFINIIDLDESQMERANALNLGRGERQAIILAEDLGAVLVMDDRKPRKAAKERGVETVGTFGIIREAYVECILSREELEEMVERLKQDLYYEEWLIRYVLDARKREE